VYAFVLLVSCLIDILISFIGKLFIHSLSIVDYCFAFRVFSVFRVAYMQ
jgi:hypothetical protein